MLCDPITTLIYKELQGNFFIGEVGFFSEKKRSTSARTVSHSDVSKLNIDDFKEIVNSLDKSEISKKFKV